MTAAAAVPAAAPIRPSTMRASKPKRSQFPFTRALKKTLTNLRYRANSPRTIPLTSCLTLTVPLLLTALLLHKSLTLTTLTAPATTLTDLSDPCSHAPPEPLRHFDPTPNTPPDPLPAADAPIITRVFATFFGVYLFEPASDIVQNLAAAARGRPADIRTGLIHAQRALREHFADPTIQVTNYTLGYSHVDRERGARNIFHLVSSSATEPHRRDVAAVSRTFDGRCRLSVATRPKALFDAPVHMVVPYSRRPRRLRWFLRQFDRLRDHAARVRLVLAVCREMPADVAAVRALVADMEHAEDVVVQTVPGDSTGFFSRAIAIRDGAKLVPDDGVMFISDIDMNIFPPMLESCRYNSIQGSQAYFPVFYSLYAHATHIDKDAGYWRDSSYGMSCMYKSDFDAVGAYNKAEKHFVGWGGEDIALSEAFQNDTRYEVFRAVEPSLRHKWHSKQCEPLTPSYDDCLAITFQQLGKMTTVGRFLLGQNIDTQKLLADSLDDQEKAAADDESDSADDDKTGDLHKKDVNAKAEKAKKLRREEMLRRGKEAWKRKQSEKARNNRI